MVWTCEEEIRRFPNEVVQEAGNGGYEERQG